MTDKPITFDLQVGTLYTYNFPQSPEGSGIFRGYLGGWGWIAMEDPETEEIRFLNLSNLNRLTPETYPPEM